MSENKLKEQYREQGYICPLPGIGAPAASHLRAQLETFEAKAGNTLGNLGGQMRAKTHLLFPWLNALCREEAILAPVRELFGADLLVYHVTCWLKEPGDERFVSWHQDGTYFHLSPPEHVTAWVALTPSTPQSGCVNIIPGTHVRGQREHGENPDLNNLLSNGQHVLDDIDPNQGVALELAPGEFSLHDTHLIHSSGPNRSAERRIGIGISYIPTHVQYQGQHRVSATLVSGEDRYQHFDPEPIPSIDMEPEAVAFHADACARFFQSHGYQREAS